MDSIIKKIEKQTILNDYLTPSIIREKDVKLGLRNPDGTGVVVGITTKGRVDGYQKSLKDEDKKTYEVKPVPGKLFYCGYDVEQIVRSVEKAKGSGSRRWHGSSLPGSCPGRPTCVNSARSWGRGGPCPRWSARSSWARFRMTTRCTPFTA